jgi:hypothetical protein
MLKLNFELIIMTVAQVANDEPVLLSAPKYSCTSTIKVIMCACVNCIICCFVFRAANANKY